MPGVPQGIFIFTFWAKDRASQMKHGKGSTCMYVVLENMMDNDSLHLTWTIYPYISSDPNEYIHFILASLLVLVDIAIVDTRASVEKTNSRSS